MSNLDKIMKPKSIAVVGASTKEHTIGSDIMKRLQEINIPDLPFESELIKADFYKILHTKYFYVCAVLSVLMSMLFVHGYYKHIAETYDVYASLLNIG